MYVYDFWNEQRRGLPNLEGPRSFDFPKDSCELPTEFRQTRTYQTEEITSAQKFYFAPNF